MNVTTYAPVTYPITIAPRVRAEPRVHAANGCVHHAANRPMRRGMFMGAFYSTCLALLQAPVHIVCSSVAIQIHPVVSMMTPRKAATPDPAARNAVHFRFTHR